MEGILYEPRSLWSIANVVVPAQQSTPLRTTLNRQHFTNRTRWPMTLKRVALTAVNYTFNSLRNPFEVGGNPAFMYQAAAVVQMISLSISAPQRYNLNAKSVVNTATCAPRPTWDPPKPSAIFAIGELVPVFAALTNTSQLMFDHPLYIPRTAAVEWQLSALSPVVLHEGGEGPDEAFQAPNRTDAAEVTMLYQESGGMFFGSARQHRYNPQPWVPPGGVALSPAASTEERWPFPPDLISGLDPFVALPGISDWWDPKGLFSAKSFKNQNSTRDGATKITDMRVAIDQVIYDLQVAFAFQNAYPLLRDLGQVAPLSTRLGTRVRNVDCGSGAWWWRPGAPLALVFDAKTPALVYDLPEAITLEPGDTLDVEMTMPPNPIQGEGGLALTYHIGVSFNGYSPIEG